MWCIPPEQDAAFVCQMEQVLEVYRRPYDPRHPVVCMDEQPKQLISEVSPPVPAAPGQPARVDYEYVREGVCTVWMFVEPLGGWRDVPVTETKTAVDWARQVQALVNQPRYCAAERITVVCDNPPRRTTRTCSPRSTGRSSRGRPCGSYASWSWCIRPSTAVG
jgi:hypothetical protein